MCGSLTPTTSRRARRGRALPEQSLQQGGRQAVWKHSMVGPRTGDGRVDGRKLGGPGTEQVLGDPARLEADGVAP